MATEAPTQPETSTDTPIQSQTLPTPPTETPGPTQSETSTESPIQSQTLPTPPSPSPPSPSPSPAPTMPETEAPTEPPTEAPTEPETQAPTEPETQAPTESETEAPTEPQTEAPTEPETQASTEPETKAPTEPETEAPTEPETEAPTEPETQAMTETTTVCNIHCDEGIPKYDSCECVQVVGCEGYNIVANELMNITDILKAAGQSTDVIDSAVADLNDKLADLAQYCVAGPIIIETVSDKISYIKTKILELTYQVDQFASQLAPVDDCGFKCKYNYILDPKTCTCTCPIDCDKKVSIYDWKYCQCSPYEHADKIYSTKRAITRFITKVQNNVENTTVVHQYLETLYDLLDKVKTSLSNVEYNFDTIDLNSHVKMFEEYEIQFKVIETQYNEWFKETVRCSSTICGIDKVLKYDCSCYSSSDTDKYFAELVIFNKLEGEILIGPSDTPESQAFDERTVGIRKMFEDLYKYWVDNDSFDQATVDQMLNDLIDAVNKLREDWDNYVSSKSRKCTALKLNCDLKNTVINLKICKCSPIDGYSELQDDATTLDALMNEIDALSNSAKIPLLKNL